MMVLMSGSSLCISATNRTLETGEKVARCISQATPRFASRSSSQVMKTPTGVLKEVRIESVTIRNHGATVGVSIGVQYPRSRTNAGYCRIRHRFEIDLVEQFYSQLGDGLTLVVGQRAIEHITNVQSSRRLCASVSPLL
jgi:hypothetical protein